MSSLSFIRSKYLDYLRSQGHAIVPSDNLVPENDPSTLFTSAGMQQMIPYFFGAKHPEGQRVANSQKCFRADDIEEVGDNRHTTFFEMLGNWSFGDYFKTEQIGFFFTFLTQELGLDPHKLYVSVFAGNAELGIDRDEEAIAAWKKLFKQVGIDAKLVTDPTKGMQDGRIFCYGEKKNWWSRSGVPANMPEGEPGGPDSEVFYDFGEQDTELARQLHAEEPCHINCDCGRFLEIGNSVFMQYQKTAAGFEPLAQANIDFGGGLERLLAAYEGQMDVFRTQGFWPLISKLQEFTTVSYEQVEYQPSFRIIADHLKAATMLMADGVLPSSKAQGYILRRLLRRALRQAEKLQIDSARLVELLPVIAELYQDAYPEVQQQLSQLEQQVRTEQQKFSRTLSKGLREFEKMMLDRQELTAAIAFKLYESFGFPLELSIEEALSRSLTVQTDIKSAYQQLSTQHSDKSRLSLEQTFKSGLADHGEVTTKYHTTTHLLHAALRQVLGEEAKQKGSNITAERLRFDFAYPQALTTEQKQQVEDLINGWIAADLAVTKRTMSKQEALDSGAVALFVEKYPDTVNVYSIGEPDFISRELCSGPHVERTGVIGQIEIFKEKAVADGVRRIYARLKR